jgi:hypothetical protein
MSVQLALAMVLMMPGHVCGLAMRTMIVKQGESALRLCVCACVCVCVCVVMTACVIMTARTVTVSCQWPPVVWSDVECR